MGGRKVGETAAINVSALSGVYQKMPFHCMFQIAVSFYLLYTQVGLAFLAGAVFITSVVKKIYKWKPLTGRPAGRPKSRWEDDIRNDMRRMQIVKCPRSSQMEGHR
jgi:hypothetical protein